MMLDSLNLLLKLSFWYLSHIPPFVSVIPVDLLIQPSFVYLIPMSFSF